MAVIKIPGPKQLLEEKSLFCFTVPEVESIMVWEAQQQGQDAERPCLISQLLTGERESEQEVNRGHQSPVMYFLQQGAVS